MVASPGDLTTRQRAHIMSEFASPPSSESGSRSARGQSLVEFALLLPLLMVLFLGIADFGRVFQSGISIEAAARNAAEAAAQEYLRNGPGNPSRSLNQPTPVPGEPDYNGPTYYRALHDLAARTACREARTLPNTTYTPDDPATTGTNEETCRSPDEAVRPSMPVIMTCVHDDVDPFCGDVAYGAAVPPECLELQSTPSPTRAGTVVGEDSRYVEVRVCHLFTTMVDLSNVQLPLGFGISVGDIYIERANIFTVGYYPPPPTPTPPLPPPPPTPEPCSVPIASFTAAPLSGTSPLDVAFTDTSTEVDCPILSWDWDFGDGTPNSVAQHPTHTFTYSGADPTEVYTVTLSVTSGAGSSQTAQTITIGSDAPCEAPIASFTASPPSGPAPLDVQFTDASTPPVNCPIDSWEWDFGDGSPPSTLQDPQHTYTDAGIYTVTLTVSSATGPDTATIDITVEAAP